MNNSHHNSLPGGTPPYLIPAVGSHLGVSTVMLDSGVATHYQLPATYMYSQTGHPVTQLQVQGHSGMLMPNSILASTGSVDHITMLPLNQGYVNHVQPSLPQQMSGMYTAPTQPPLTNSQLFHSQGQAELPKVSHMPSGLLDYQQLLIPQQLVQQQMTPALLESAATQGTQGTQGTPRSLTSPGSPVEPKLVFQKDKSSSEHESRAGMSETTVKEKRNPLVRQQTFPAALPVKLNASLTLSSFGNSKTSSRGGSASTSSSRSTASRSSFDGSTERRMATSSLTSPGASDFSDDMAPCYEKPPRKDYCLKCQKKVYPMEQIGPIKEVLYHKTCFNCVVCGTQLNLKNFSHNPNDLEDLNIFCVAHKPKEKSVSVDADSLNIKRALTAPKLDKVNEQIRGERYHSEVLARGQPSASSSVNRSEDVYYGMTTTDQQQRQAYSDDQYQQTQGSSSSSSGPSSSARQLQRHERQFSNDEVFETPNQRNQNGHGSFGSTDDRSSVDAIATDMSSKMKVSRKDSCYEYRDSPPLMRSDRPSNHSSRSASPKGVHSPQEDGRSLRSSTGSSFSGGHDISDLDTSFSSQNRKKVSVSSLERSDRPSLSSEMRMDQGETSSRSSTEDERYLAKNEPYLAKNEPRRLDRPSQYS